MSNIDLNKESEAGGAEKAFSAKCFAAGVRVTPQRLAIYRELINLKSHPCAETLYHRVKQIMPSVSKDTLSRTLGIFTEIGVAFVVEGCGDTKRYDGAMENHQHFRCVKCRKIIDFYHRPYEKIEGPGVIEGVYMVLKTTVYLEGVCEECGKGEEG